MNDVLKRLQFPGIGLIIVGFLNGAIGCFILISGLLQFAKGIPQQNFPVNEGERIGYFVGYFGGYAMVLISVIAAPIIICGGIQMLKGKRRGLIKTASILALLPVTTCCFVVGIPVGIWSLIVLSKPDVKAYFNGETNPANYYPPQPPTF